MERAPRSGERAEILEGFLSRAFAAEGIGQGGAFREVVDLHRDHLALGQPNITDLEVLKRLMDSGWVNRRHQLAIVAAWAELYGAGDLELFARSEFPAEETTRRIDQSAVPMLLEDLSDCLVELFNPRRINGQRNESLYYLQIRVRVLSEVLNTLNQFDGVQTVFQEAIQLCNLEASKSSQSGHQRSLPIG